MAATGESRASEREFAPSGGMLDLKKQALQGGTSTAAAQVIKFSITMAATMVLARLLSPKDFGLVAMVTSVTGFLTVFKDAGLSSATVQRDVITEEQVSTLFWVNVAIGVVLALVCAMAAPVLAGFYREPKLVKITLAIAGTFVMGGLSVQHQALLRRALRFKSLAAVDIVAGTAGVGVGIALALLGFGYWAAVSVPVASALAETTCTWLVMRWRPKRPRLCRGTGGMIRFGGLLSSVSIINYLFRNVDNVMIGWYWGARALGLYQKAYGLLLLPINQINAPISGVAISALSRVQNDPQRMRRYFLGGYEIAASLILPVVCSISVFSYEVVLFVLGPRWEGAVGLFRLLVPAALVGSLLNPIGWLFVACGRADRQLKVACVWSGLVIMAFGIGLGFGPTGVATAFSLASCLLAVPVLWYAVRGTPVSVRDIAGTIVLPAVAAGVTVPLGMLLKHLLPTSLAVGIKMAVGLLVMMGTYGVVLLVLMGRWRFYLGLAQNLVPAKTMSTKGEAL